MTAHKGLYIIAAILSLLGWGSKASAENDVTVVSTNSASTTAPTPTSQDTVTSDGTPVIHKSLHKKKDTVLAAAVPTIETGLPVARYEGINAPIKGVSTYSPTAVPLPATRSGSVAPPTLFASTFPTSVVPLTSAVTGNFTSTSHTTSQTDFVFTNFSRRIKNVYPWKREIITTKFWIGEGATPISSTTNVQSSWDEQWMQSNHGSDSPDNRNGWASGSHASTVNPFYIALPFNDLAFPDKAHDWLPRGWYRHPEDGKQVSACKDRWLEIKNAQGRVCFAQWEDVGPLRYDHAEYVFGDERPIGLGDDHAGLDVSPAVADYLGVDGKNRLTSWRFVDDEDVLPGPWLLLDEQAVLFTALHQMKNGGLPRASEPIDDPSNIDANKKKVDQSKG